MKRKSKKVSCDLRFISVDERRGGDTNRGPMGPERGPWAETASREDLLAVLDNAPCCIVIGSWPLGKILYTNRKTVEVTGYGAADLPTVREAEKALSPDAKEARRLTKLVEEHVAKGDVTMIYKNVCRDGVVKTMESVNTVLNDIAIGTMTDVTRREEAEAKIRESEVRFRSFFEECAEAILLFDGDAIMDCNPAALDMLGFSKRGQVVGVALTALSPDRQPDGRLSAKKMKSLMALVRNKKSHRFEWVFMRPDGSTFPAELITTAIVLKGKPVLYITLRNISASKEAEDGLIQSKRHLERRVKERTKELSALNKHLLREIEVRKNFERELGTSREQLRHLSEHLQQARETERTRIAREIHDELGQSLSALKIDINFLGKGTPGLQEQTTMMEARIDDTINTVRAICSRLRPPMLDRFGLSAALQWYLRGFENRTGITCNAEVDLAIPVKHQGLTLMLFRIVQEAMTNILRHAAARNVKVTLTKEGVGLMLKVEDDGKGISEEEISTPKSLGIIGINERVRFWGGRLQLRGIPGRGTTMTIWVPIHPRKRSPSRQNFELREAGAI